MKRDSIIRDKITTISLTNVASGVYFFRLSSEGLTAVRKVVVK